MIVAVVMLVFATGTLAAGETDEAISYKRYDQALGAQYGLISGSGISYQLRFGENALQVAFGFLYNGPGYGSLLDYTVGVEFQHTLYGDDFQKGLGGQIYLFAGFNHSAYVENIYTEPDTFEVGPYIPLFTLGLGIGVEIILFQHFSIPVEFGYAASLNPREDGILNQLRVDLVPQVGLRYRF